MSEKPEEDVEDTGSTGRGMDAELRLMGRILRLIEELDEPAKGRVMAYLTERYQAAL